MNREPGTFLGSWTLAVLMVFLQVFGAIPLRAEPPLASPGGQAFAWGYTSGTSVMAGQAAALAVLTDAVQVDMEGLWAMALRDDGSLLAWGRNTEGQTNFPTSGVYTYIACGWTWGAAVTNGGAVVEWGTPGGGGVTWDEWWATKDPEITNRTAVAVAAGDHWTAALMDDSSVWAWGEATTGPANGFVATNVVAIEGTWYRLICLHENGTVSIHGIGGNASYDHTPPSSAATNNIARINGTKRTIYTVDSNDVGYGWSYLTDLGQYDLPSDITLLSGGRQHSIFMTNGVIGHVGDTSLGQDLIPSGLTNAAYLAGGDHVTIAIQTTGGGAGDPDTIYVSTTGNDTTGDGTIGNPYLTIQKGVTEATSGQTVYVETGDYPEYVTTAASGVTIQGESETTLRAIRINNHTNITLSGLTFEKTQASGVTWQSAIRVEASAHNLTLNSVIVRNPPHLSRTNWTFDATSNSVYSASGSDWAAAGFEVGGKIRTGASSIEPYIFANMDQNFTILGTTNDALYIDGSFTTETNSTWSMIYASPSTHEGIQGVDMIVTGSTSATNLVINGGSYETFGIALDLQGPGPVTVTNVTVNSHAWAGIRANASQLTVSGSYFTGTNFIFYSEREQNDVPHDGSPDQYDFRQGYIRSDGTTGSNVTFNRNWFHHIDNPLGQIGTGAYGTNWTFSSNVVVGVMKQWDGLSRLVNFNVFNNTFYRVSFDSEGGSTGHALTHSGASESILATNHTSLRNVFVDIGDHSSTNAEGFYANANQTGTYVYNSNFVTSAESMGWAGKASFTEANGFNGGDPLLVNKDDPLGPDGLPFTADDGLRPLPTSPLAIHGLGALTEYTLTADTPVSHFNLVPATYGWKDQTGTNFNTSWEAVPPFSRTNFVRPWNTPEAMGEVPLNILSQANTSISGDWFTDSYKGITEYQWTISDGTFNVRPMQSRTNSFLMLTSGVYTVNLTVPNHAGNIHDVTRYYRVLPQDSFAGSIWHVDLAGTGDGTSASTPTNSIQGAYDAASGGDYIRVAGNGGDNWDEQIDFDKAGLNESTRITLAGYDGVTSRVWHRSRSSVHTFYGWKYLVTNTFSAVYIFQDSDSNKVVNCWFEMPNKDLLNGSVHIVGSSSPSYAPTDQSSFNEIIGCMFTNTQDIGVQWFGGLSNLYSANIARRSFGEGDFIRPRGMGHIIQDSEIFGMSSGGTSGHADLFQLDNQSGAAYWFKDILVQRMLFIGDTNSVYYPSNAAAIMQVESGATAGYFGSWTNYTNFVIRNSLFKNIRGAGSDSLDGIKLLYNTFYQSPSGGANVTSGGDPLYSVTGITRSGTTATATTATAHGMSNLKEVNIVGANEANFNQSGVQISGVTATTFNYMVADSGATEATGTMFVVGDRGSSFNTLSRGNIFHNINGAASADSGWLYTGESGSQAPGTSVDNDYDAVYPTKTTARWEWNGQESNGFNGVDPEFVNELAGNLHIGDGSALLDVGLDMSGGSGLEGFSDNFWAEDRGGDWTLGALGAANVEGGDPEPPPAATGGRGRSPLRTPGYIGGLQ